MVARIVLLYHALIHHSFSNPIEVYKHTRRGDIIIHLYACKCGKDILL